MKGKPQNFGHQKFIGAHLITTVLGLEGDREMGEESRRVFGQWGNSWRLYSKGVSG